MSPSQLDDPQNLLQRLSQINWLVGDATRGRERFERFTCARCHTGRSRLGPEPTGIASRFSRDDLFLAITDPNRDVSPTYRVTQVMTVSGKVIIGQIIYESPEATLIQTGPDTTVRLIGAEIAVMQKSPVSPMPTGLLRMATNDDPADLYAYLKALRN